MSTPKITVIDEHDCFGQIKEFVSANPQIIKPKYFIAPNKNFLQSMTKICLQSNLVIIHRHIWLDDCHKNDKPCQQIVTELKKQIAPIPIIEVGGDAVDAKRCPSDMLAAFTQIAIAVKNLGTLIGAQVSHPSPAYNGGLMTVSKIEMLGNGTIGATLKNNTGEERKYYSLQNLSAYATN